MNSTALGGAIVKPIRSELEANRAMHRIVPAAWQAPCRVVRTRPTLIQRVLRAIFRGAS